MWDHIISYIIFLELHMCININVHPLPNTNDQSFIIERRWTQLDKQGSIISSLCYVFIHNLSSFGDTLHSISFFCTKFPLLLIEWLLIMIVQTYTLKCINSECAQPGGPGVPGSPKYFGKKYRQNSEKGDFEIFITLLGPPQ